MTDQNKSVLPLSTCLHLLHDSENEMLESIVESLNKINARLDALEKN